jgi:Domain of unknown function (DUF4184)
MPRHRTKGAGSRFNSAVPLTLLSHQGVVLPLKVKWPTRINGLALCIGSIAPDLSYAWLPDTRIEAHNLRSILTWSVPLSLALLPIARHVFLPSIARLHPALARVRATAGKPTGALGTILCCGFGALSHIVWDGTVMPEGSFPNRFSLFTALAYEQDPWRRKFRAAWTLTSALGALLTVFCLRALWRSGEHDGQRVMATASQEHALRRRAVASVVLGSVVFASAADAETGAIRALWCVFLGFSLLALPDALAAR